MSDLPLPPIEFRRLVGPTDPRSFENAGGGLVFPDLDEAAYSVVLDFGCGCGRLARQLIQQHRRPDRYLGIDRHREMVAWCQENLAPHAPGFDFRHHDIFHPPWIPDGASERPPLPVSDGEVTLLIAWSIFTHLLEHDAAFYLRDLARVLSHTGVAVTTWFLFDKRDFPMMQEFQNTLMINSVDPSNAVIFDRAWLLTQIEHAGLVATQITPPKIRGYQWVMHLQRNGSGRVAAHFPRDLAPRGIARPPV